MIDHCLWRGLIDALNFNRINIKRHELSKTHAFTYILQWYVVVNYNFAKRFNRGVGGSKLTLPLAEKFFKHEKRAIKYHSQNAYIMRKTLDFKGFSLYQPFGCFVEAPSGFESALKCYLSNSKFPLYVSVKLCTPLQKNAHPLASK